MCCKIYGNELLKTPFAFSFCLYGTLIKTEFQWCVSLNTKTKCCCLYYLTIPQVDDRLKELENVNTFTDFVQAFSQFGSDMVELAHLSGDRQNVGIPYLIKCLGIKCPGHLLIFWTLFWSRRLFKSGHLLSHWIRLIMHSKQLWNSHPRHKFFRAKASRDIWNLEFRKWRLQGFFKKYFPPQTPCCFVRTHVRLGTMPLKCPRHSTTLHSSNISRI